EGEGERSAEERVGQVHDGGPDRLANGHGVVGGAAHEVAGRGVAVERRVQPHEVFEERIAEVDLDAAADPVEGPALEEAGDAAEERDEDDGRGVAQKRADRDAGSVEGVDGPADELRGEDGEGAGDEDEE